MFNVTNLKRSPAFKLRSRRRNPEQQNWRQSIIKWQEKASKNQNVALTHRNVETWNAEQLGRTRAVGSWRGETSKAPLATETRVSHADQHIGLYVALHTVPV